MKKSVFITGGAGFIGSRLVRALVAKGYGPIHIYDCLHPQVHGNAGTFPEFDSDEVICTRGRVEDAAHLHTSLARTDPDVIIHLASETGTGQSLDELDRYVAANVTGTSNLLTGIGLLPRRSRDFLLSSSRSVYGEGPYKRSDGSKVKAIPRTLDAMNTGDFRVFDEAGHILSPVAADSHTPIEPLSVYASTKAMQEYLLLNCAEAKNLRPKILRFQNVYGPGQSLRNPYTGVLSIFAAQIIAGKQLNIFEDGAMTRDFVFVDDVVNACVAAIESEKEIRRALNIGSGTPVSILETAKLLLQLLDSDESKYYISGDFRLGDIRHAYANIEDAQSLLSWSPRTSLGDGLSQLAAWSKESSASAH